MSAKRNFPEHIGRSRQFKAEKRRELREFLKALAALRSGCAYCPGYPQPFETMERAAKDLKRAWSEREWGR
jgi:hypothetical protein